MRNEPDISRIIDWAVASQALPGEAVCGDFHLVKPIVVGALLAVVDGLGHGDEAVAAAKTAVVILEQNADELLTALVKRCHEGLTKTRGVVMTVVRLSAFGQFDWLGVGNVEAVLLRADSQAGPAERVLLRSGVVGYQLPHVQYSTRQIAPGDLLVFATDGIAARFEESVMRSNSPQQIADEIMKRHFKGHDDALVLVVRFVGRRDE